MNEEATIFPIPADSRLHAQAEALARAAWLMAAPDGSGDPPQTPGVDPKLPQGRVPLLRCCSSGAIWPDILG
jgi:hypothetical protein